MALSKQPEARARQLANLTTPPPAEVGNERSLVHGTRSERKLAPVRERHARELRERYPGLDDYRLAILASRLAKIELATAWLRPAGHCRPDPQGRNLRNC